MTAGSGINLTVRLVHGGYNESITMYEASRSVVRTSSFLCLLAAVWGCDTRNVTPNYSLSRAGDRGHGMILGSATVTDLDETLIAHAHFYINAAGVGPGPMRAVVTADSCQPKSKNPGNSDFVGSCGRLFALDLPAGNYQISDWLLETSGGESFTPKDWDPIPFKVEAGKATYIGDLHMLLRMGKNLLGLDVVAGGWPLLLDNRVRDAELLRRKYPWLNDEVIQVELVPLPKPEDSD
jgi:hypothetical protein